MPKAYRLLLLMLVAASSGCAGYSRSISKDEAPASGDAFLYGRFSISGALGGPLSLDGHETMGFTIKCTNGDAHVIRFSRDDALQVIRITPSTCQFAEIVYSNVDGMVRSRKPAPQGLTRYVEFGSGKAYYLGDYFAAMSHSRRGNLFTTTWEVKSVKDDYLSTTEALKKNFPRLSDTPTENRMIGKTAPGETGVSGPL